MNKILMEQYLNYISDRIRLDYLKNAIDSKISNEQPSANKLKDTYDGYDDLTIVYNRGTYIDYYEGFVQSCWVGFYNKEEYKGLNKTEIVDKFISDRFSKIAKLLNYKIVDYDFKNSILHIKLAKIGINESSSEININGWKLHPQADPSSYQIIGDFNNTQYWKAKTLVANNGGNKGEFEDVGYIWFNELNKTFLPISRNDEHRLGSEMMYDMHYTRKDYYPLWLLGNNYVYDKSDEDKFLKVGKALAADGWKPHGNISKMGSQIEIPITQFLKTGKIEFQKGKLTEKGQTLIDYLTELTKLDTKILKGGSEHRMAEKNISKYITKAIKMLEWFTSVEARPNYLLYKHDLEDIVKYDLEQLGKMNDSWIDFQKTSFMIFRFGGFKNRVHEIIKDAVGKDDWSSRNTQSFFGNLDIALGIFNKMDSMNEAWVSSIKRNGEVEDIFVNPSVKEWKKIIPSARGIITYDGDLYIANFECIHGDIVFILQKEKILEDSYYLPVQRDGETNEIYIGESVDEEDIDHDDEFKSSTKMIYASAKKKNSNLKFVYDSINNTDTGLDNYHDKYGDMDEEDDLQ